MSDAREKAYEIISRLPDDKVYYVVKLLEGVDGLTLVESEKDTCDPVDGYENINNPGQYSPHRAALNRIGFAKGKLPEPYDLDFYDEEIAEMFGVSE